MFRISRQGWLLRLSCVAPIVLAVQAPGQAAQDAAQAVKDTKIAITVLGCVRQAEVEAANGPTGSSSSNTRFVLTEVTATEKPAGSSPSNGAVPAPAGTTGKTVPTATGAGVAPTFRLEASDETLTPHVGHKVEIVGIPDVHAGVPITSGSSPSPASAPKLTVDSIKPIGSVCPERE